MVAVVLRIPMKRNEMGPERSVGGSSEMCFQGIRESRKGNWILGTESHKTVVGYDKKDGNHCGCA